MFLVSVTPGQILSVNITQAFSRCFCTSTGVHLCYIQLVGYDLKRHDLVSVRFDSWSADQSTSKQKQNHEGEGTDCRLEVGFCWLSDLGKAVYKISIEGSHVRKGFSMENIWKNEECFLYEVSNSSSCSDKLSE